MAAGRAGAAVRELRPDAVSDADADDGFAHSIPDPAIAAPVCDSDRGAVLALRDADPHGSVGIAQHAAAIRVTHGVDGDVATSEAEGADAGTRWGNADTDPDWLGHAPHVGAVEHVVEYVVEYAVELVVCSAEHRVGIEHGIEHGIG